VEEFSGQQIQFGEQTKELVETFLDRMMDEVNQEETDNETHGQLDRLDILNTIWQKSPKSGSDKDLMDRFSKYAQASFTGAATATAVNEKQASVGILESLLTKIRGTHVDIKAEQGEREASMYLNKGIQFLNRIFRAEKQDVRLQKKIFEYVMAVTGARRNFDNSS